MNEPKKRGRPAKTADQSGEDAVAEFQDGQELTPEQVQAWIRANRDKMPPLPEKVIKRKRKMLRM